MHIDFGYATIVSVYMPTKIIVSENIIQIENLNCKCHYLFFETLKSQNSSSILPFANQVSILVSTVVIFRQLNYSKLMKSI